MEYAAIQEEHGEWEQIPSPFSTSEAQLEHNPVFINDNFFSDSPVFPPCHHEGLPITPQPPPSPSPSPSLQSLPSSASSASLLTSEGDGKGGSEVGMWGLRARMGLLSSGFVRVFCMIRSCVEPRIGLCSILSAATNGMAMAMAAVLISFLFWTKQRRQRRISVRSEDKERLMILLREKDQKINQLLLQIAQMNEILEARMKVPVLRVG